MKTSKITLDAQEQQLTIYADGSNGPCIIKLDTDTGEVTVEAAAAINIKADSEINIKSNNIITLMSDTKIDLNTTSLAFSASTVEVNGSVKFNSDAVFMGGINVNNGDINVNNNVNVNGSVNASVFNDI